MAISCSPANLANAAKCFWGGLGQQQLLGIMVHLRCRQLAALGVSVDCSPEALLRASKCFCGLGMQQLLGILAELDCEILNAGGSGGQSCLLCGEGPPVDPPACDCALYTNTLTGSEYWWNPGTGAWCQRIKFP
jgi:hypothetical protein